MLRFNMFQLTDPKGFAEKAFHEEAIIYFKEQRELIKEQSRVATIMKWCAVVTAFATLVIAWMTIKQYENTATINEIRNAISQTPIIQQK